MQVKMSRTVIGVSQLLVLGMVVAAVTVLGVTHAISTTAIETLIGVVVGHAGIVSYNGATSATNLPPAAVEPVPAPPAR